MLEEFVLISAFVGCTLFKYFQVPKDNKARNRYFYRMRQRMKNA